MFWLVARDGVRTSINAVDMWEAMRDALRSDCDLLVAAKPGRVLGRSELLAALKLGRPGLFDDYLPGWEPPTFEEFRELLRIARLTGSMAAAVVGVTPVKIRKWAGGDGSPPYAVWRLLVIYARLAEPSRMELSATE